MSGSTCNHLAEDGISRNSCRYPSNFHSRSLPTARLRRPEMAQCVRNPPSNSCRINLLPATPTDLILCVDFRLSPLMFSIFYEQRGRGEGTQPNANGSHFGSRWFSE
jgi:hypothetical protein